MNRSMRFMLLMCGASLVSEAQGYQRTVAGTSNGVTYCVTWADRNFSYEISRDGSVRTPGDSEFTALDAAFATWQSVSNSCSDFKFVRAARSTQTRVGKGTETENLLIFRERDCRDVISLSDPCYDDSSCGNRFNCWDHSSATIATTTVTFGSRSGTAVDADIEFNAAAFFMTAVAAPPCPLGAEAGSCVAYDIQNTATHEIGHAVGFDHVTDPTSTMTATAPQGETAKRVIDFGTSRGFCETYPNAKPPVPCDELAVRYGRIVARTTGNCASVDGGPWVGFGFLLAWLSRRRMK
jgi:uncharacterized protein (TIGR03382 family)